MKRTMHRAEMGEQGLPASKNQWQNWGKKNQNLSTFMEYDPLLTLSSCTVCAHFVEAFFLVMEGGGKKALPDS